MSTQKFVGQTALVTGAAKRLGRDIAKNLADHGANVIVHYNHSEAEAKQLVEELHEKDVQAWAIQADLRDAAQADGLMLRAVDIAGPINFLVNNASVFPPDDIKEFSLEKLMTNITVNSYAPLVISRAFSAEQEAGAIVNMLDCRITDYDHKHASYHLSKKMLYDITRACALEFAPNTRVNAVAPGLVIPPEGHDESYLKNLVGSNPLNSYGSAQDISDAVIFLLEQQFITGQVIYVDGGRNLKGSVY